MSGGILIVTIFQYMEKLLDKDILNWGKIHLTFADLIGIAIGIALILVFLRFIRFLLKRLEKQGRLDSGRGNSVYLIIKYLVIVIAIGVLIESLGFKLSIILAGSAALLVGLGLGLQDTFNDFVSGIIILVEGSIQVGDVLEVEGIIGRVVAIKLRTSQIVTRDGVNMIVPNHKFITDNVINWSLNRKPTRFKVHVGVSYKSDVEQVREILMKSVEELPGAVLGLKEYKPVVRLADFGESAIAFDVLFWSYDYFKFETIRSDLRFIIARKFKEGGIEIPFPQRDVHIKTAPPKQEE